ncbi:MAG TPA: YceI family protein [Acidimicrobiales bacterium]|nr:YceI family protein [Acidimicrobiales bacterium]
MTQSTRYIFDSVRSCVWVSGRSSLHPINTETRGITGWFEASRGEDGSLNLDLPIAGELELAVEKLTSGNQLYDHELRRRIDARRYPTIEGLVTKISADGAHPRYSVAGDIVFHGKTRSFEHGMDIELGDDEVSLTGDYVFDIREFGMKPPSMLMIRVYPEIAVRVELYGTRER